MFKKIVLGCMLGIFSGAVFAGVNPESFSKYHQAGVAVQIAGGVDLAYYTTDHKYCLGIGGFTYTDSGNSSSIMKPTAFIRRNIPLTDRLTYGFGISVGTIVGEKAGESIEKGFRFKQYISMEYAATERIYFQASVRTIDTESYEVNGVKSELTKYIGGSNVQIAYRF